MNDSYPGDAFVLLDIMFRSPLDSDYGPPVWTGELASGQSVTVKLPAGELDGIEGRDWRIGAHYKTGSYGNMGHITSHTLEGVEPGLEYTWTVDY